MCSNDDDKEIKFEFFISSKNGKHKNIGSTLFTITDLKNEMEDSRFSVTKQKETFLGFRKLEIKKRNSFLEYIFGGCEINLAIAVDFTLSNGEPSNPNSLHCNNL